MNKSFTQHHFLNYKKTKLFCNLKSGAGFTPTPILASLQSFFSILLKKFKNIKRFDICGSLGLQQKIMPKMVWGFTLIELLVVIAIIGILSSTVLASVNNARAKAKEAKVVAQLKNIDTAMGMMEVDTGEWPGHQAPYEVNNGANNEIEDISDTDEGLSGTDGSYTGWDGPYIKEDILDSWGNPYFFDTDYDINRGVGSTDYAVVIGSYGPNGVGSNLYDSDDIIRILTDD